MNRAECVARIELKDASHDPEPRVSERLPWSCLADRLGQSSVELNPKISHGTCSRNGGLGVNLPIRIDAGGRLGRDYGCAASLQNRSAVADREHTIEHSIEIASGRNYVGGPRHAVA